jgi:hypothetical protein
VDPDVGREEIESLFNRADKDGGGVIDFEEFYNAVCLRVRSGHTCKLFMFPKVIHIKTGQ